MATDYVVEPAAMLHEGGARDPVHIQVRKEIRPVEGENQVVARHCSGDEPQQPCHRLSSHAPPVSTAPTVSSASPGTEAQKRNDSRPVANLHRQLARRRRAALTAGQARSSADCLCVAWSAATKRPGRGLTTVYVEPSRWPT